MSDYSDFVEEIEGLYEELWNLAKQKLKEESDAMDQLAAQSIFAMGPLLVIGGYGIYHGKKLGSKSACDYEGTRKKLLKFVKEYCFDYASVSDAIDELSVAIEKFNIDEAHSDISGKLERAWPEETNDTARLFKKNYVSPIISTHGKQYHALRIAKGDLEGVPALVDNNRTALKESIVEVIGKLRKHSPFGQIGFDVLHLTLFSWGLIAPDPVTGRASGIIDLILGENKSYLLEGDFTMVAEAFEALRDSVDAGEKAAKHVIKGFSETVDATLTEYETNHDDYYVNRPRL